MIKTTQATTRSSGLTSEFIDARQMSSLPVLDQCVHCKENYTMSIQLRHDCGCADKKEKPTTWADVLDEIKGFFKK